MARQAKVLPTEEQVKAIKRAVVWAGSQAKLADAIEVTPATVSNWVNGLNGVTENNAKLIQAFTEDAVLACELSTKLIKEAEAKRGDSLRKYR